MLNVFFTRKRDIMSITKKSIASAASVFTLAAGMTGCGLLFDTEVDISRAFCEISEGAKYPVRIVDTEEGYILHEGGYKRFEIDEEKRTCLYRHNSGDGFIYKMK